MKSTIVLAIVAIALCSCYYGPYPEHGWHGSPYRHGYYGRW